MPLTLPALPQPLPERAEAAAAAPARRSRLALRSGCASLSLALVLSGPWLSLARAQAPPAAVRLPALGESASDEFNPSAEKRLGETVMRSIRQDPDYLDDPLLLDYLQSLWSPLVAAAQARGDIGPETAVLFPYELFLVRDRSVNAFALPGGYVGVFLGLVAMTETPDELASVLAHELSHVTQRHIARQISGQSGQGALGLAAILLGLVLASRAGNADMAQAAVMGGQGLMVQGQLNFSRAMEREADRSGFRLMQQAGFAPDGMATMFDKLALSTRLNDDGAYPYLRSHPLSTERMGEARQRVQALGDVAQAQQHPLRHALMRMRSRALMDGSVLALRRLQGLADLGARESAPWAERLPAYLGAAMASARLRDFDRAAREADAARALLQAAPAGQLDAASRQAALLVLADVALARGDLAAARALVAQVLAPPAPGPALGAAAAADGASAALRSGPVAGGGSRPLLLVQVQLALADGRAPLLGEARDQLQTWLADHPGDAAAWSAMAQVAERQQQPLRNVRAQAEARAALGDLRGAIDRLRAGQDLVRRGQAGTDFIEASVIDARLRELRTQLQALRDEEKAESRGRTPPSEPG